MPLDSGRKKDGCWSEVKDIENDKKKVVCTHCNGIISKKIERVRAHMEKCKVKNANSQVSSHEAEIQEAAEKLLSPTQSRPSSSMSVSSSSSAAADMSRQRNIFPPPPLLKK